MPKTPIQSGAVVGVAEHGNSVILVSLGADGRLLDRRLVELTRGLPTHPYHHEGSWAVGRYLDSGWSRPVTLPQAIALVEQVQLAAAAGAAQCLAALAAELPAPVACVALRACPRLPETIEARIKDTRAATVADSVMYRAAVAAAAQARGWSVRWYDRDRVMRDARSALGGRDVDALLKSMGKVAGPPWQAKHKLAAAAALAAGAAR